MTIIFFEGLLPPTSKQASHLRDILKDANEIIAVINYVVDARLETRFPEHLTFSDSKFLGVKWLERVKEMNGRN
jgi:hypothetical protein